MLQPGQTVSLSIEKPAAGGRMIGRSDGQVVLVTGVIPGERADVRIERVARGVAYGDVASVEEASPDRRADDRDPLCGGCVYSHIAYPRQLEIKAQVIEDAFLRIARMPLREPVQVAASPEQGYRMRARLHLRGGRIGFFREGTHDLCAPRQTRQLRDDTCDVLDQVASALRSLGVTEVREVEVSENIDAVARVVHLESAAALPKRALAGIGSTPGLTGLTASGPDAAVALVSGEPWVVDRFAVNGTSVSLRRHVLAFFQANRYLLPSLVGHVVGELPAGGTVFDLYAGTGLFSVAAASRGSVVVGVEGDRTGAADLEANAATLGGRLTPLHQPVERFLARADHRPDAAIVDPPRTGMSKEALSGAIGLGAPVVVYVSCDVATLARDARRWVDAGYDISKIAAFDLFPNTPHVETVVTFRRA